VTFSISAIQALLSLNANVHNQWYSVNSVDQLHVELMLENVCINKMTL
jgi:hypothetical protein